MFYEVKKLNKKVVNSIIGVRLIDDVTSLGCDLLGSEIDWVRNVSNFWNISI